MRKIFTPLTEGVIKELKVGEEVFLEGRIYTARDRTHKKLIELWKKKEKLPFSLRNEVIYYCGPNIKNKKLGSCGPTSSLRMDKFLEEMLREGVIATIGKGRRAFWVKEMLKKYHGVYFLTYGGCGAYLREKVKSFKLVGFPELGAEAIYEFYVEEFPLIVGIDCYGRDIYAEHSGSMQNEKCPLEAPPEVDSPQAKDPPLAEKM